MKNQTQLPAKLDEQVKASGLELSEAQTIAANYAPIMNEVAEIEAIVQTLEVGNPEHVEKAKRARIELGRMRSKADAQKKADKEKILVRGRYVDGLFNVTNGYITMTQERAKEIEEHAARVEAERIAKLQAERSALVAEWSEVEIPNLGEMSEVVFTNLLAGMKAAKEAAIEAERKAEEQRQAEAEAERQRIAEQAAENARLKAEAEAREKQVAEERAKAEAERKAIEAKAEQERKAAEEKAAAERAKIEAERKAEAEARAKVEAELQAKKDAEAKAEADRIAAEKKAEAERIKAAKAPIKVKLNAWVDSFTLPATDVDTDASKVITEKFNAFKAWAKTQVENV
jgi:hypothetical protein